MDEQKITIRLTAQAVIYRKLADKVEYLVLKRWDKFLDTVHYRLVKGGIEDGETPEQTIIREIQEETGLSKVELKEMIGTYSYVAQNERQEVQTFLVEQIEMEDLKIDSSEEQGFIIEDAEWNTLEETIEKLHYEEEKEFMRQASGKI